MRWAKWEYAFPKRANAHLNVFLRTIHTNSINIVSVELHNYRETINNQTLAIPGLSTLKNLKLNFEGNSLSQLQELGGRDDMGNLWPWTLNVWLSDADNLETLTVSQDPIAQFLWFDVIHLLRQASWPNLLSFYFTKLFTRSLSLQNLLQSYDHSLRHVRIE